MKRLFLFSMIALTCLSAFSQGGVTINCTGKIISSTNPPCDIAPCLTGAACCILTDDMALFILTLDSQRFWDGKVSVGGADFFVGDEVKIIGKRSLNKKAVNGDWYSELEIVTIKKKTDIPPALSLNFSSDPVDNIPFDNEIAVGSVVYLHISDAEGDRVDPQECIILRSSNPYVTAVNTLDGEIAPKSSGTTTIRAVRRSGLIITEQSLEITVVDAPPTFMLKLSSTPDFCDDIGDAVAQGETAYLCMLDMKGNLLPPQDFELKSYYTSNADMDADGTIVAITPGMTTLRAVRKSNRESKSFDMRVVGEGNGRLTLGLSYDPVVNIPFGNTIAVGSLVYIHITDTDGNVVDPQECMFRSTNPYVANINSLGIINTSGSTPGTVTLGAIRRSDGANRFFDITVVETPPTFMLKLSPTPIFSKNMGNKVVEGETAYLCILDMEGNALPPQDFELSSSKPTFASIDADGKVAAIAPQTARISVIRKSNREWKIFDMRVIGEGNGRLKLNLFTDATFNTPADLTNINKAVYLQIKETEGGAIIDPQECQINVLSIPYTGGYALFSTYGTMVPTMLGEMTLMVRRKSDNAEGYLDIIQTGIIPLEERRLTLIVSNTSDDFSEIISSIKVDENAYLFINSGEDSLSATESILTSSDDAIATISSDGTITGLAAGTVTITAINGANEGTVPLKVENAAVNVITPEKDAIKVKATEAGIAVQFEGEATIELYAINGILIDKAQACQSYSHSLNKGVYIIRINGQAIKFVR